MNGRAGRRAGMVLLAATLALSTFGCQSSPESASVTPPDHPLTALMRARASENLLGAGRAWLGAGDSLRAVGAWAGAPSFETAETPLLRIMAEEALAAGNPGLARDALEAMVARDRNDLPAQFALGLLLAAAGGDEAAAYLRAASAEPALAPSAQPILAALTADSPLRVGWALFAGHFWAQAEIAFTRAAAGPAFTALDRAALALSRDYQGKDGDRWMNRALSAAPGDAGIWALQAMHLRLRGDREGSLSAARRAAALAPESPAMLAQLGAAYQRVGRLSEARTWYERARALAGGDPRYEQLAAAAAQTGDAALDALLEALQRGDASAP